MAIEKYFLGIDGGGTKTTAIVSDQNGNIIGKVIGKTINFNAVGGSIARQNFKEIIEKIEKLYHIQYFDTAFIGMSAIYKKAEEEEVRIFTKDILDAGTIYMDSDLYIALEGLMTDGPCMVIVSGTGSMGIIRDKDEKISIIGGWGYILGDQGSAYYIAIEGIKRAILASEGISDDTALIQRIRDFYQLENIRGLIDVFYNPIIPRDRIAAFATEVYECALNQDNVALEIINDAAEALAHHAFALMDKIKEYNITIGVYGGVFESNELLYKAFKNIVRDKYNDAIVKFLEVPPELGAIIICFKKNNIMISEEILNNLQNTYSMQN